MPSPSLSGQPLSSSKPSGSSGTSGHWSEPRPNIEKRSSWPVRATLVSSPGFSATSGSPTARRRSPLPETPTTSSRLSTSRTPPCCLSATRRTATALPVQARVVRLPTRARSSTHKPPLDSRPGRPATCPPCRDAGTPALSTRLRAAKGPPASPRPRRPQARQRPTHAPPLSPVRIPRHTAALPTKPRWEVLSADPGGARGRCRYPDRWRRRRRAEPRWSV